MNVSTSRVGRLPAAWGRLADHSWVGLFVIVVVLTVVMSLASRSFLSTFNIFVVLRDVSTAVLIGMAQMVVLAIGQMNLSIGAIGGLVVVVSGGLMEVYQWPVWAAVGAGLGVGILAGWLNGFLVSRTGISSFIVTIATASIFLGLNLGITQAQPFYHLAPDYTAFGQARWGFVPLMSVITIAAIAVLAVFFYRTVSGRQVLAVGGNTSAAETAGIPVRRCVILAQVISGVLAATAGMLWSAQLGAAQPMIGQTWLLPSFAVPIIGGVALSGGSVRIWGTVLAAFVIAIINNALVHLGVDPYYVQFLLGLLVLGAVGASRLARGTSRRRRWPA